MVFSSWLYARSVFCPLIISSTNPFSSPSFAERLRNSGRTRPASQRVNKIVAGMVTKNTISSSGAMDIIIKKLTVTVTTLCKICSRSEDRDWFTVSTS